MRQSIAVPAPQAAGPGRLAPIRRGADAPLSPSSGRGRSAS
jgi:hypothetical protein